MEDDVFTLARDRGAVAAVCPNIDSLIAVHLSNEELVAVLSMVSGVYY